MLSFPKPKEKVLIKTYGCSFNQLDSQIMAGKLKKDEFEITNNEDEANLILINSCSVKNLSETKFFKDIRKFEEMGKKVMVSGCITQAEESYMKTKLKGISVIGTNDLDKVSFVATQTLNENPIQILSPLGRKQDMEEKRYEKEKLRLSSNKISENPLLEIVPINEGCLNTCSFCKTKQARGQLFSYSIESIKESVKKAVKNGAKEIYLTSQDTGCYGFDIGTNLPSLLREILKIKGKYKVRIGMGNPNHFKKIIDEVLEIMLEDDRIYKFLHIPLQSGSDRILDEMRRMYHLKDFENIVIKARLKIPDITLANDIIVAYPTETQEDFNQTLQALKKTRPNVLNFSRFWLRPKTPAEKMYKKEDFIDGLESKRRVKILSDEFKKISLENNGKWIGWKGEVIITENGKEGTHTLIARNNYYKLIIVDNFSGKYKIGDKLKIRIDSANWKYFLGEVV